MCQIGLGLIKTKDSINCLRQLRHEWSIDTAVKEGNLPVSLYSLQCDMHLILPWIKKNDENFIMPTSHNKLGSTKPFFFLLI